MSQKPPEPPRPYGTKRQLKGLQAQPDYNFPDGDLVLESCDGRRFRVHALVLRLASSVFADMLTLPVPPQPLQPDGETPEAIVDSNVVELPEDEQLLEALLDIIYPGRALPDLEFYPPATVFASRLASAAAKYDMPDVTAFVRSTISQSCGGLNVAGLSAAGVGGGRGIWAGWRGALEAYALACRYGWTEEAQMVSARTLLGRVGDELGPKRSRVYPHSNNFEGNILFSDEAVHIFEGVDASAVLRLVRLHEARRHGILAALDSLRSYSDAIKINYRDVRDTRSPENDQCPCSIPSFSIAAFDTVKLIISRELTRRPLGDTVCAKAFWDQLAMEKLLFEDRCGRCGTAYFDKLGLMSEVKKVIERLPLTVESASSVLDLEDSATNTNGRAVLLQF